MRGLVAKDRRLRTVSLVSVVLGALGFSCTGAIEEGSDEPRGAAGRPGVPGRGAGGKGNLADGAGPMAVRRLDREELGNTLHDLIGASAAVARTLPRDSRGDSGFLESDVVSGGYLENLLDVVEALGADLARNMRTLVACDPAASGETVCANRFFTKFGRRAYRRPLDPQEVGDLVADFNRVKAALGYPFHEAMRVVVQSMLISPGFLYHWELGTLPARQEMGLVRLTPHEIAARLSYFLWASMPDDKLFAAADQGRLAGPADVERETRRMLADARARARVGSFHTQWLGLEKILDVQKDAKLYAEFDRDLAVAMANETPEFATRTILDGEGTLRALLTSPKSFVTDRLSRIYGVQGITSKTGVSASLNVTQRAGLFTQAAFLALSPRTLSSDPIRRGLTIFRNVLCGEIAPPPPNATTLPDARPRNLTTRESFEAHDRNPCAQACHQHFDPLGYAFEHYDAIGRWRALDAGKPVDSSGTLIPPSGGTPLPFDDALDLANLLATSEDARRCFTRQWFRFAVKRREVRDDEASLETAYDAFAGSGDKIRELLIALPQTRSFLYRSATVGEVLQ